jgi:hypothetical protein
MAWDTTGGTQLSVAARATNELFMIYGVGMEGKGLSPALVNLHRAGQAEATSA